MAWTNSIETIYNCPVVKGTKGIIRITKDVLRAIAGATRSEKDEWLIVLMGRSENQGLVAIVDDFYVPEDQERFYGHCDIDEEKYPFPSEVKAKMLGYLHSHHQMEAVFSGVDTGPKGFNQRGQISIVTSNKIPFQEGPLKKFAQLVGFSYQAVMRYKLSCGAFGKSYADIIPDGVANWPLNRGVVRPVGVGTVKHLGDCQRYHAGEGSDDFQVKREGNCGWHEEEAITRWLIYGADGSEISDLLPRAKVYQASRLPPPGSTFRNGIHHHLDPDPDSYVSDDPDDQTTWREYLEDKYGKEAVSEALVRITDYED